MLEERGKEIVNVSHTDNPMALGYRAAATTYVKSRYELIDAAKKDGIDLSPYTKALQIKSNTENANKIKAMMPEEELGNVEKFFARTLGIPGALAPFEGGVVEAAPDYGVVEFHYCPLVKAWQDLGLPNEEIGDLCLSAMNGDVIMANELGFDLDIQKTIGCGHDCCRMVYTLKKPEAEK